VKTPPHWEPGGQDQRHHRAEGNAADIHLVVLCEGFPEFVFNLAVEILKAERIEILNHGAVPAQERNPHIGLMTTAEVLRQLIEVGRAPGIAVDKEEQLPGRVLQMDGLCLGAIALHRVHCGDAWELSGTAIKVGEHGPIGNRGL